MSDQRAIAASPKVALSFAGEQRAYVQRVAHELERLGVDVLYDEFVQDELWGNDLAEKFDEIFRKRADFVVVFVSEEYVSKGWTRYEHRSALARAVESLDRPYILPVRFDQTELPGLQPSTGYLSLLDVTPEQLAGRVRDKVSGSLTPGVGRPVTEIDPTRWDTEPPTPPEVIYPARPSGWRLLYAVSYLWHQTKSLGPRREALTLGVMFVHTDTAILPLHVGFRRLVEQRNAARGFVPQMKQALAGLTQAIDPEDVILTDPEIHAAVAAVIDWYRSLIEWSEQTRSMSIDQRLVDLQTLTSRLMEESMSNFERLVEDLPKKVSQLVKMPDDLAPDGSVAHLNFVLPMEISDELAAELNKETERVRSQIPRRRRRGV